jgi:shikimate dehydrogenase
MTDRYAVIGNPIEHSKSPLIHTAFAHQTGKDIQYEKILAPLDGFAVTVKNLVAQGYKGCNVTVPFKFEAFKLAIPTERAKTAKAINTLTFHEDHSIEGDNTDGAGLVRDIQQNMGIALANKRILLIGAGGAAWGALASLRNESPKQLIIANRTIAKAEEAARILEPISRLKRAHTQVAAKSFQDLQGEHFDIVINATSAGLSNELPPIPKNIFATGALAYDMMYGRDTPFMRFAKENGAEIVADGLGMLVEQAAESFNLWHGIHPDTAPILEQMRHS